MKALSCIEEDGEKRVNMAHLAIIGRVTRSYNTAIIGRSTWTQMAVIGRSTRLT